MTALLLPSLLAASVIKDDIMRAAGTRAAGMGGAFVSVADDYSAYFWNPAGLVTLDTAGASVFFDSVFYNSETGFGANFTCPLFSDMTAAFSYMRTNYNDSAFYNDFFYFTWASWLGEGRTAAFGANFKLMSLAAGAYSSGGFAASLDAAAMIYPQFLGGKMKFGAMIQDLDTVISWSNGIKERVPVFYKAGASWSFDAESVVALDIGFLDYGHVRDPRFAFNLGGEKWFKNKIIGDFGLRAGWQWREGMEPNSKFTLGASYRRDEFAVNYVYMPGINSLGDTHKLDFSWFFSGVLDRQKGPPRQMLKEPPADMARGTLEIITEKFKPMQFDISQKYLSPNNDKRFDSVDFILKGGPQAAAGVNWKIEITDAGGSIVREIKGVEVVQPKMTWDGADNSGVIVKDGDYTVNYSFAMDGKPVWGKVRIVSVDTTGPRFSMSLSPKTYAPSKKAAAKKMEIRVLPKDRDIKSWKLFIRTKQGSVIRRMSGEGLTDRIFWAGDDALGNMVKDGDYETVVDAEDFAGNVFEQVEPLTVDTYIARFDIEPDIRIFGIGLEKVTFTHNMKDTDRLKKWDLEIRDSKGALVKAFRNNSPAVKSVAWNGTDGKNNRVRKGAVYVYRLVTEQKNGLENVKEGTVQSLPPDFEGVGIELTLAAVDFPPGKKEIPVDDYGYLNQAAEAVKKYAKNYYVIIKGYTTDAGGAGENLKLSTERVMVIRDYLITQGVPDDHIYTTGYGDGSYAGVARKEEAAKNPRRVEVELLTK